METIKFCSFGGTSSGKIITHSQDLTVVQARNPYGRHNLVVVMDDEAIRHGNATSLRVAKAWMPERAYRKVVKHLVKTGWIK